MQTCVIIVNQYQAQPTQQHEGAKMQFKAGERLKMVRELMGLTREEFAEDTGLNPVRLKNVEYFKVRMSELEYDAVIKTLPELACFVTHEGMISADRLRTSSNPRLRLIVSRLEAGDIDNIKAKDWIK